MIYYESWQHHLNTLLEQASDRMRNKYTDGQAEHGGQLWRKQVLGAKIEEDLDNLIYGLVLVEQHEEAKRILNIALALVTSALRDHSWRRIERAQQALTQLAHLMHYGNVEGDRPEGD